MQDDLRSPTRLLIELRMEHAQLNATVDRLVQAPSRDRDELLLRRLKKQRLVLRDQIDALARELEPKDPA